MEKRCFGCSVLLNPLLTSKDRYILLGIHCLANHYKIDAWHYFSRFCVLRRSRRLNVDFFFDVYRYAFTF